MLEKYHLLRRSFTEKPPSALKGEGPYLYLDNGQKVIDSSGGAAVLSIGHGNKDVAQAMADQASKICYVTPSNFTSEPAEELASLIITEEYEKMGYSKVMFVNSGSEANENAYKLVRQYYYEKGETQRTQWIGRDIAYHGNTILCLTMSGTAHRKAPFEDVLPYNNFHKISTPHPAHLKIQGESDEDYTQRLLEQLDSKFQDLGPEKVMAVWFEPVLGTSGGCDVPPRGYLKGVRSLCNKYGAMLVYDEVICGSGRSGSTFFAWQQLIDDGDTYSDIQPDIITVGKALCGGYAPLSAVIMHEKFTQNFIDTGKTFTSGHTFQSHIVSCAAAIVVQKYIRKNNLFENVTKQGKLLKENLKEAIGSYKNVLDIRGLGLFYTIELVKDKNTMEMYPMDYNFSGLAYTCILKHGVSVYPGRGSIDGKKGYGFLVAPPFNVDESIIKEIVKGIQLGLKDAMDIADKDLA